MSGAMGLDLSLTGSGWAHINGGGWTTGTVVTKGSNTDTVPVTWKRLCRIRDAVLHEVTRLGPALVVIESPAFSRSTGHAADRAGLFWLVYDALAQQWPGQRLAVCKPDNRIRYALGKGVGNKDAVLAVAIKRYPSAEIRNNNEGDAVLLAALGARRLVEEGQLEAPVDHVSQACLGAYTRIAWPAL